MSTQKQLLYPNHKHFNQLTVVFLVVIGFLLIGLVPFIYGSSVTDASENHFVIPTEAELWNSLGK